MSDRVDTSSRLMRAPAPAIYRAFATPDAMEAWLPPEGMTGRMLTFAFREGGSYRMRLTYDDPQHTPGKSSEDADEVVVRFVKLVPHARIEQAVRFSSDDVAFSGEMRITWTFDSVPNGTCVTVRCENIPSGIRAEDHQAGLASTLNNLAAFVEGTAKWRPTIRQGLRSRGKMSMDLPRLYSQYADWFHLLTAPDEYAEEANVFTTMLKGLVTPSPRTLLELGSGGGNNAWHMKAHFELTLTDISPEMLAVSRSINPECEHLHADMRELRLGRMFDAVFAHDALDYLLTLEDLARMAETAWAHCRPGGAVLLAPDCFRETFRPATEHGGHDGQARALRYLEWSWDPDPADRTYSSEMVYVMRHTDGTVQVEHEQHVLGLFSRSEWLDAMSEVGFRAEAIPYDLSDVEPGTLEVIAGLKPPS